jgi:hypothetical protein
VTEESNVVQMPRDDLDLLTLPDSEAKGVRSRGSTKTGEQKQTSGKRGTPVAGPQPHQWAAGVPAAVEPGGESRHRCAGVVRSLAGGEEGPQSATRCAGTLVVPD